MAGSLLNVDDIFVQSSQSLVTKPDNGTVSPSGAVYSHVKTCDLLAFGIQNPITTDLTDDASIPIADVFNFFAHTFQCG